MSIIQKLMLSYLALALGPILLIAPLVYLSLSQTVGQQVEHQLESVATIQSTRAQITVTRNRERLTSLAAQPTLAPALDRISHGSATAADRSLVTQVLQDTKSQAANYTAIVVADPTGTIIGATDPNRLGQSLAASAQPAFTAGRQHADVSNYFFTIADGQTGLYLTAPVQLHGRLIGVTLIESNATSLFSVLQDHATLGDSGEVMIMQRSQTGDLYLAPLRFDPQAAFQRQAPHTDAKSVITESANHPSDTLSGAIDYRGHQVLAASRPIQGTNWRLIAKMDESEAYAPLAGLRDTFLILIFVILVIAVFAALFVARSTLDPLLSLSQAAENMSKGDLSQRVPVVSSDEFGSLATTFNNMADSLEKMDQAKSEFTTLMSHQLRTPATAVKGFMSMVLDGYAGKVPVKQAKLLQDAFKENERQMRIVDDILLVEAANTNQMVISKTPTDLIALVKDVVAAQAGIFREHGQKITLNQPKGPLMLSLDAKKMRMVLENIINNASKYSPDQTEIKVTVKHSKQGVAVSVSDQGFGIAPSDIGKLFQRFSRLPNPNTNQAQGSGLGLYLVKKITELHQGEISVVSEAGKGATFTIYLPSVARPVATAPAAQAIKNVPI